MLRAQLDDTITVIASLDWGESSSAQREASAVLGGIDIPPLLGEFKTRLDELIDVEKSVEKTTHYKWFLSEDPESRFQVWLHEYKASTHRREGHATVAHNHRFWLTSLILRGGFTDTRYERIEDGERNGLSISAIESRKMRSGETMVLSPDEIHSLGELRDGTLSLVVQSKPVRSYSEVFEGGEVRRYRDLGAQLAELRSSL
jgi:predicted metal-dependent enzyme (double-stranded beta helix superfamily)